MYLSGARVFISVLIINGLFVMFSCNNDTDVIKKLETDGLAPLIKKTERLEKLPEGEIDREIENVYRDFSTESGPLSKKDPKTLNAFCRTAKLLKRIKVLRSMLRRAKDDRLREKFMYECIGVSCLPFLRDLKKEWARSIDYKKKPHLTGMIEYLDNRRDVAKKIIADPESSIGYKCRATIILGMFGTKEDLDFLKDYFGLINPQKATITSPDGTTHVVPMRFLDNSPIARRTDCAKDAADSILRRLKKQ